MRQRYVFAILCAVWLVGAAVLLSGATVRIPPARTGAITVRAAGGAVSTGTGASTDAPRDGLIGEWIRASTNYTAGGAGVDAVWTDTSDGTKHNLVQTVDAKKPALSGSGVVFAKSSNTSLVSTLAFGASAGCSIAIKHKFTNFSGDWWITDGANGSQRIDVGVYSSKYIAYRGGGTLSWTAPAPTTDVRVVLWLIPYNTSTGSNLYVSGSAAAGEGTGNPGTNAAASFRVGAEYTGAGSFNGEIYGIRVWDHLLVATETANIDSWTW